MIIPVSYTHLEEWMENGEDVLVVYDDLSKHATAYRTLSLPVSYTHLDVYKRQRFGYRVTEDAARGETVLLFDYQNRNPLNYEARVVEVCEMEEETVF